MSQVLTSQPLHDANATAATRSGWGKLAMWLFLASDSMTFGGLLIGYAVLRSHNVDWPHPSDHLALAVGLVMTALLLGSSATMAQTLVAAKESNREKFRSSLLLTIIAGALFLTLQTYEWSHLMLDGMTISSNPWGAPLFGATFYTLTGFHGLHVLAGVLYLSGIMLGGGKTSDLAGYHDRVEMAGLYWHFVDVVWVCVFTSVYLL
jgi:cytochrome c oxidase subunit 3